MLRLLARILAITALVLAIPLGVSAGATYLMLDGTPWTEPETDLPAGAPAPAPAPSAGIRWDLGTCLTTKLHPVDCRPGVWQLVGVVQRPGPRPCAGITAHPDTRYADGIALCLTRY
ncbi:hypothetical protein ABZ690_28185 [Streptomyces sp. NPDC006967]|uniref:hypothetical protein n=1 Tax=Streptomyces sp. NPDC006967 TaxID=3156906 RepID=UPI0033F84E84